MAPCLRLSLKNKVWSSPQELLDNLLGHQSAVLERDGTEYGGLHFPQGKKRKRERFLSRENRKWAKDKKENNVRVFNFFSFILEI